MPAGQESMKDVLRKSFFRYAPSFVQNAWTDRHFSHEVATVGEAELPYLASLIAPGDLVLDIGANFGVYSWQAEKLGARVIAFEPNPNVLKRLKLIASPQIEIREIALSNEAGTARMVVPFGDPALSNLTTSATVEGEGFNVKTATLDSMGITGASFIKIDVEGHEEAVLLGAVETIRRDLPVLLIEIEERHNAGGLARIAALTESLGYTIWFLRDDKWHSLADFDYARDQDEVALSRWDARLGRRGVRYYNNFLFLPKGRDLPGLR